MPFSLRLDEHVKSERTGSLTRRNTANEISARPVFRVLVVFSIEIDIPPEVIDEML